MCGIFGFFSKTKKAFDLQAALNVLKPRGPDSNGLFSEADGNVYLAHTRLAVRDLSELGSQPMTSNSGQYVIIFNGEIYNTEDLSQILASRGVTLKSSSDTEIVLELYSIFGEETFSKLDGMFALAIYDKKARKVICARDPYGIKPIYYYFDGNSLMIASLAKSIVASKVDQFKVSNKSAKIFFLNGSLDESHNIFLKIKEILPGYMLIYSIDNRNLVAKRFFDISKFWIKADLESNSKSRDVLHEVSRSLKKSFDRHLLSDVPVGIFLSSGIDSAVLAALASESSNRKLTCITIGFEEYKDTPKDEVPLASELAKYFGLTHYVRYISKKEFIEELPLIFEAMDQPTIDAINTWFATKAAKEIGVKVVLSGLGADELFFGYSHFKSIAIISAFMLVFPISILYLFFKQIFLLINLLSPRLSRFMILLVSLENERDLLKIKRSIRVSSIKDWVLLLSYDSRKKIPPIKNIKLLISYLESVGYMRDQLLRDSDWASMSHGVELRTPYIDVGLLRELVGYLKRASKFKKIEILSNVGPKAFPEKILNKKKTGFNVPFLEWLFPDVKSSHRYERYMQLIIDHFEYYAKKYH